MIRVVLIDDSVVVLDGITSILRSLSDIVVVGVLTDGMNAAQRMASMAPDVVIVDAQMPGTDGVAVTRNVKGEMTGVGVLYMTVHPGSIDAAIDAGADAYLMKDSDCREFVDAIRRVAHRYRGRPGEATPRTLKRDSNADTVNPVRTSHIASKTQRSGGPSHARQGTVAGD